MLPNLLPKRFSNRHFVCVTDMMIQGVEKMSCSSGHDPSLTSELVVHLHITLVLLSQEVYYYCLTVCLWCGSDRIQHLLLPGRTCSVQMYNPSFHLCTDSTHHGKFTTALLMKFEKTIKIIR